MLLKNFRVLSKTGIASLTALFLSVGAHASPILLDPNFTGTPAGQYSQTGSSNGATPLLNQPTQGVLPGATAGVVNLENGTLTTTQAELLAGFTSGTIAAGINNSRTANFGAIATLVLNNVTAGDILSGDFIVFDRSFFPGAFVGVGDTNTQTTQAAAFLPFGSDNTSASLNFNGNPYSFVSPSSHFSFLLPNSGNFVFSFGYFDRVGNTQGSNNGGMAIANLSLTPAAAPELDGKDSFGAACFMLVFAALLRTRRSPVVGRG